MPYSIQYRYTQPATVTPQPLWPTTDAIVEEYEVSTKLCEAYSSGRRCKLELKGGCPDVHDSNARRDALEKQRTRRQESLQKQRLEKSREKLEHQYNKTVTATPKTTQKGLSTTPPPTIPASPATTSQATQTDPLCKVLTIIKHNSNSVSGKVEQEFCRAFLKPGGCKWGNKCKRVHDIRLRRATLKDLNLKRSKVQTQPGNSKEESNTGWKALVRKKESRKISSRMGDSMTGLKALVTSNVSTTTEESKAFTTYAQATRANIVQIPAPQPPTIVKKKWDKEELARWACRHLKDGTVMKYLAPHLLAGKIPQRFFDVIPERAPRDSMFHYFSLLPSELRNQIWTYVLDTEQYDCRIMWKYDDEYQGNYFNSRLIPQNVTPRLLHVNREARSMAMTRFSYTFATTNSGPRCWFDYSKDRLFIHTRNPSELYQITDIMLKPDIQRVTCLAVPLRDYILCKDDFCRAVVRFRGLRHLWLVVGDGKEDLQYSEDAKLAERAQKWLMPVWKGRNPKRATPKVDLQIIDGLKAHVWKIDGLVWV
jgi:hypothetical protein